MSILNDYISALCAAAGWPATPANAAVMGYWSHLEGTDNPKGLALESGNNIWMTTWPDGPATKRSTLDIGFGPGKWNNANPPLGVGIYATMQAGVNATIKTIRGDARFAVIDRMFTQSVYVEGFRSAIGTWIGDPGYSDELDAYARAQYGTTQASQPSSQATTITEADVSALWLALFEMAAGTRPSTFGTPEQARVDAAVAALRGAGGAQTVKPHRHSLSGWTSGAMNEAVT